MPEVPKIVHERLRAAGGNPGGEHPDANVLTAFAEQALGTTERENVMAHLSACDECRELLAVRSPDVEVIPMVVADRAPRAAGRESVTRLHSWFAWNRLGWAGLVAGAAIAVGVLVTQSGKPKAFEEARQNATHPPAAAPPVLTNALSLNKKSETEVTALPAPSEPVSSLANQPAASPSATRRDELKTLALGAALNGRPAMEGKLQAPAAKKDKDVEADRSLVVNGVAPGSVTETVKVSGAAAEVASAQTQPTDALAGNEATPVTRAKAARVLDAPAAMQTVTSYAKQSEAQKETADSSAGQPGASSDTRQLPLAARNMSELAQPSQFPPQWRIGGDQVERSLDSGAHWKSVFQPHRPLLSVAATTTDVWAGGKSGDLYHSSNAGITWTPVHPSANGQTLADDVTHIEVHSNTHVVLFTGKNESWSTTDGGATWGKK